MEAVPSGLIDVWNANTFDRELTTVLTRKAKLIRNYLQTAEWIFKTYELADAIPNHPRPENPYAPDFGALEDEIRTLLELRTIRAWHYTRLIDGEVLAIIRDGITLSTRDTLRSRLDRMIESGALTDMQAQEIYQKSVLHSDQREIRSFKFWMVSHPSPPDDSAVKPLLARWGGEAVHFWLKNRSLLKLVSQTGQPRVIELAVPVSSTRQSGPASVSVIETFADALGCTASSFSFDLYVTEPLRPNCVLRIHSAGDPTFNSLGRLYPEGYERA